MPRVKRDFVALIEACYRVEQPVEQWLQGVAEAGAALLDSGLGLHAYTVDFSDPAEVVSNPLFVGGRDDWRERWRREWWDGFMRVTPASALESLHSLASVTFATELWQTVAAKSETYDAFLRSFSARGRAQVRAPSFALAPPDASPVAAVMYPDSFNVGGIDASGRGAVLVANMANVAGGPIAREDREAWERMGAHIASGHRLWRRLQVEAQPVDAVLDPKGKVHDAAPDLRDTLALASLRDRVTTIERMRGKERSDPRVVTEAWTALAEGRWSLVDQFERDGRRYYVARPNRPQSELESLSEREAQVARLAALGHANKLIAYELGVSVSTVATHIKTAARKLGAKSRLDLIRAVRRQETP